MLPATRRLMRPPNELCSSIFQLLLDVNQHRGVGATLRVAGGWVRDQLLQLDPHDVDIAIETPANQTLITGEIFANHIAAYQKENAMATSTISVVKTNPDRSKHIETAQMKLFGLPVEFCHLRADDYCATTRIPTTRPGSPREDALRRDFTVNALFYNLHTQLVEDWTGPVDNLGQGFRDMERGLLCCPLAPRETFMDDPLRLLRGIRFSGQLGYTVDQSIVDCVTQHGFEIIPAIHQKLSRERIGIEVDKMLGGKDPTRCLEVLHSTALLYTTLLIEYYFVTVASSGDGKVSVGVPTKNLKEPNRIHYTLPHPAMTESMVAIAIPPDARRAVDADLFPQLSGKVAERISWLRVIGSSSVVQIPLGEPRVACSLYSFLPALLNATSQDPRAGGPSFPATVYPHSKVEGDRCRLTAILTHATKLPARIAILVGRMMEVGEAIQRHFAQIVSHYQQQPGAPVQGPGREALYYGLKAMRKDDPCCFEFVLCILCLEYCQGASNWSEVFALLKQQMTQDTAMHSLLRANGQQLKGNEIAKELNVSKKAIGLMVEQQERFLIHNPSASNQEILQHLAAILASSSASS